MFFFLQEKQVTKIREEIFFKKYIKLKYLDTVHLLPASGYHSKELLTRT